MNMLMDSAAVRKAYGGISKWTMCQYRKSGKIPPPADGNCSHPRWLVSDIERALEEYRSPAFREASA